jgi:regulator of RNase E activity RraA
MDVIVGDSDGVMVIPKVIAEEVLREVESRKAVEDETRRLILEGMSAEQAAIKMGYKDL